MRANLRARVSITTRMPMRFPTALAGLLAVSISVATPGSVAAAVPGVSAGAEPAAAESVELPERLTREQVRDLLSKLSDDQVRALLIRQLDKVAVDSGAGARSEDADTIKQIHDMAETARLQLARVLGSWGALSALPGEIWTQVTLAGTVSSWSVVVGIVLMFVVGWVAEIALRRVTGIGTVSSPERAPEGLIARLGTGVARALMRYLALLVFGVAAFGVMCVAVWDNDGAEPLYIMLLSAVVIIRAIAILMDVVLAPRAPGLRLVTLDDGAVWALRLRLLVLAGLLVVHFFVAQSLNAYAIELRVAELVELIVISAIVVALIFMIWEARYPYAAIIRGGGAHNPAGDGGFVESMAAHWHIIAITAVLILYVIAVGRLGVRGLTTDYAGIKTLALLMVLPLADLGLRRVVARLFQPDREQGDAQGEQSRLTLAPASEAEERSRQAGGREIQAVVLKNLRILLALIAVLLVLGVWGIEPGAFARSMAGERIGRAFFDIIVTALLAYAVWSLVKAAVSYHLDSEEESENASGLGGETEVGGAGKTRMQTLLPLFRKFILITLLIMGVLIVLSSLGVNIGPLIAGAGVVGIAIGFGAQALVRDIVSGIFFLLDDAFRMGEYVEIGEIRGVVEAISIRSLRLRHHNGPLHTIPFGEIRHLTNYSRDWAIMKFELRLPFETDIDKVRKIIKNVGKAMEADEELAPLMLSPLKSQGVNRMDDSALIIRCKFTAMPGQQFYVRREAFTRIQKAFEENGIQFAPKRVIVEAATPALAIAGAAALEAEDPKGKTPKTDDRG